MRKIIFILAFTLIGTFAFANNNNSKINEENDIDNIELSIENQMNKEKVISALNQFENIKIEEVGCGFQLTWIDNDGTYTSYVDCNGWSDNQWNIFWNSILNWLA